MASGHDIYHGLIPRCRDDDESIALVWFQALVRLGQVGEERRERSQDVVLDSPQSCLLMAWTTLEWSSCRSLTEFVIARRLEKSPRQPNPQSTSTLLKRGLTTFENLAYPLPDQPVLQSS